MAQLRRYENAADSAKKDSDNRNGGGVTIELDVGEEPIFDDPEDGKKKKSDLKTPKKVVKRYQKWQKDQGVECTQVWCPPSIPSLQ